MTDEAPESHVEAAASPAPPSVPAGWYPTPDGKQRYWDGSQWTNLPWDEGDVSAATTEPNRRSRRTLVIVAVGIVVVLGLAGGGFALKNANDARVAHVALVAHQKHVKEVAAEKAKEKKDAADAERTARKEEIPAIETSVKAMAVKHAADGVIDGPILDATCSPVGGGSTDDLTQLTTVFQCFVGTVKNADGTETGYYYNATMNWSTDEYTYGLGKPNG